MKKIMIAAAIVCAAAVSQAATFLWTTADKAYMPYAIGDIKVGANQAAATSTNSKSMSNWADASAVFTYTMFIDGTKSEGTVTYSSRAISVEANNDGFVLPTTEAEGSKTFNYSIVIKGTYTDKDNNVWTMTSDTISGTTDPYTYMSSAELQTAVPSSWTITMTAPEPPTPTPEPTSALLMVIGMAGLALRRRRA